MTSIKPSKSCVNTQENEVSIDSAEINENKVKFRIVLPQAKVNFENTQKQVMSKLSSIDEDDTKYKFMKYDIFKRIFQTNYDNECMDLYVISQLPN